MTTKQKPLKKRDANQVYATRAHDEDESVARARTVLRPTVQAAVTLKQFDKTYGDLDLKDLIDALTNAANEGDLGRAEAMLTAQAHTLDAIFNNLARRAAMNMGEYMQACETYLKLALRAQSQCRATLEALAEMKQPRSVAFVGQANIAHGHQQVNNGATTPRAGKTKTEQNELLEGADGERLDTGPAGSAGGVDPPMETVGQSHGPSNG